MAKASWVKSGGVWRKAYTVWRKSSGVWNPCIVPWIKVGGIWKDCFVFSIDVSPNGWEFPAGAGYKDFSVITQSGNNWSVSVQYSGIPSDWLTLTNGTGSGTGTFRLTIADPDDPDAKTSEVTISSDLLSDVVFNVTQLST
jgi:hypothetical protein